MLNFSLQLFWMLLILSINHYAFGCINDAYTINSETLWGSDYGNVFETNLITSFLIAFVQTYIIIRFYFTHKKEKNIKEEAFFTTIMVLISWIIIFGIIILGDNVVVGIIILFLVAYYLIISIYRGYLMIKNNFQNPNLKDIIFIIAILFYLIFLYFSQLYSLWSNEGIKICAIGGLIFLLITSLFFMKNYRSKIITLIILVIVIIFSLQICIEIIDNLIYPRTKIFI